MHRNKQPIAAEPQNRVRLGRLQIYLYCPTFKGNNFRVPTAGFGEFGHELTRLASSRGSFSSVRPQTGAAPRLTVSERYTAILGVPNSGGVINKASSSSS